MIDDKIWKLRDSNVEHLGIVISPKPGRYPLHAVLCSHRGMEGEMGASQCEAPACFESGTRVDFDEIRALEPQLFSGKNPLVRFRWQLSQEEFQEILASYKLIRTVQGRGDI
jgi:hypothetical protein